MRGGMNARNQCHDRCSVTSDGSRKGVNILGQHAPQPQQRRNVAVAAKSRGPQSSNNAVSNEEIKLSKPNILVCLAHARQLMKASASAKRCLPARSCSCPPRLHASFTRCSDLSCSEEKACIGLSTICGFRHSLGSWDLSSVDQGRPFK